MNILHVFTRKSLARNRTRTLVTIVGIALSMSLFTAVIEGAYSGQQFLIRAETAKNGSYMLYYADLTETRAEELAADSDVKRSARWDRAGWAEIGSQNEEKPYLLIQSIDRAFPDLVSLHLTGRLPENSSEILLPNHLASNGGVQYQIGDVLTLDVGARTSGGGYALNEWNPYVSGEEAVTDTVEKTYTVVGFYDRLSTDLEPYACPGYTALTTGERTVGEDGAAGVLLELKHAGKVPAFETRYDGLDHTQHRDLLAYSGVFGSGYFANMLYGFAGILVFLVAFGSVSLIYNSFSISVSERTRQFGILKSVGATKKQLRRTVLYEALWLGGIGIPAGLVAGCAGIGLTLYLLRDAFSAFVMTGVPVKMRLVLHPIALLTAAGVCLMTTLISAWIPARKAMKISAVDAIRQTGDVKIQAREVRTSRITETLFGFEGTMAAKNFKRNRKRYRATVLSLFLSVTLFISASSFCDYLTSAVRTAGGREESADIQYYTVGEDRPAPETVLTMLSAVDGVGEAVYYEEKMIGFSVDPALADDRLMDMEREWEDTLPEDDTWWITCVFLDDAAFRTLCADNGLDPEPYFDADRLKALVQNEAVGRTYDNVGGYRWRTFRWFQEDRFPFSLPPSEPERPFSEVTIAAPLKTGCMGITENILAVYVPFSLRQQFLAEGESFYQTSFRFRAKDHARVYAAMRTLLVDAGMDASRLNDHAADKESMRMMVTVVNVFSYGFIILISLIALANVFNTISTNIALRRREFAMLKSVGLGEKGFMRMMNYECVMYGCKGLLWGLPASAAVSYGIYRVTNSAVSTGFYIPWYSVTIAVGSVFLVVFAAMLYAAGKIRHDNPIDALKNEAV